MLDVRKVKRGLRILADDTEERLDVGDWIDSEDSDEEEVSEVEECIVIS